MGTAWFKLLTVVSADDHPLPFCRSLRLRLRYSLFVVHCCIMPHNAHRLLRAVRCFCRSRADRSQQRCRWRTLAFVYLSYSNIQFFKINIILLLLSLLLFSFFFWCFLFSFYKIVCFCLCMCVCVVCLFGLLGVGWLVVVAA